MHVFQYVRGFARGGGGGGGGWELSLVGGNPRVPPPPSVSNPGTAYIFIYRINLLL